MNWFSFAIGMMAGVGISSLTVILVIRASMMRAERISARLRQFNPEPQPSERRNGKKWPPPARKREAS